MVKNKSKKLVLNMGNNNLLKRRPNAPKMKNITVNIPKQKPPKKKKAKITAIGKGLRSLGGFVGGHFGVGHLGTQAGAAISRIFGQGDYTLTSPGNSSFPPSFAPLDASYSISHREYLQDITVTPNFESIVLQLNPGLNRTFPWLSQVASNFEEYEFKGLVFYLKTNSATAIGSKNTALGVWGMVTQYDASDVDFASKRECENYMGCVSAAPCESVLHAVECKKAANVLGNRYVRTGPIDSSEDLKFYDAGKVSIFSAGVQEASVAGELWVSYHVVFKKPKLPELGAFVLSDKYTIAPGASGPSNTNPFGNTGRIPSGSIGTTIFGSTNKLVFPSYCQDGYYMIQILWYGASSASIGSVTFTENGSVQLQPYWANSTGTLISSFQNSGLTVSTKMAIICVKKFGATQGDLTFVGATLPVDSYCTVSIMGLDSSLFSVQKHAPNKLMEDEITELRNIIREHKYRNFTGLDTLEEELEVESKLGLKGAPNDSFPKMKSKLGLKGVSLSGEDSFDTVTEEPRNRVPQGRYK